MGNSKKVGPLIFAGIRVDKKLKKAIIEGSNRGISGLARELLEKYAEENNIEWKDEL